MASNTDDEDDHPFGETWLGILLLWSAFNLPLVAAPVLVIAGVGSFPPVRRWVSSSVGDVPYAVEVGVGVVYMILLPVALGSVGWVAYQSSPSLGRAAIIAILMLGIMGVIAIIGVYAGRGVQSLT